ncbi:MAG: gliding motility-associated C-terminal domain-containing protein [Bacteroidetes bacterium]|nr:gliding motility-associated C-terminal domain-containing protein [Bacteroidota bacterium]
MKRIFILLLFLYSATPSFANHTKGGWMYYKYLGPGINDPNKLRYTIGILFYTSCNPTANDDNFSLSVFEGGAPFTLVNTFPVSTGNSDFISNCVLASCYPCLDVIPSICYWVRKYETTVELTPSPNGYILSKQRCCRVTGINNLTAPSNDVGETYSINIPGFNVPFNNAHVNSSPQFVFNDTAIVCGNNAFSINFNASDPDGDSLAYSFCNAFTGGDNVNVVPEPASNPPYSSVPYAAPYSGSSPLGSGVTINPVTGLISGIAPPPGEYVLTVCVAEYRNGIHFADSKKELHLSVADCSPVVATLDPEFTTCGDLTLSFSNETDNIAIQNWFWQFGDPASGTNDSSDLQFPTHTFTTAGDYIIKLIVNRGLPCVDSTEQLVHVFPGFFPGFFSSPPYCAGQPVSFVDTTRTNYGVVSNWSWNFGNNATLADTSHLQNPTYTYTNPGPYTVQLISSNSKGCKDTIRHDIVINAVPTVSVSPNDTSYCALDSLQLNASGTAGGTYSWLPATNITTANISNPLVFPPAITQYIVTHEVAGCKKTDSITVTPLNDLTNNIIANPATICQEDTLTLSGSSNKTNHLSWQWSPTTSLQSPATQSTRAWPSVTTTYTLTTRWGNNCVATKQVNIPVTPLAIPHAGPDTTYCVGQTAVPLLASGGVSYHWTPTTGLSDPNIANPFASPSVNTNYIVAVGVAGCSKTKTDTILVKARSKPALQLTNDTLICSIDTLQLNAAGTGSITWWPNYNINSLTIPAPLVSPDIPTMYHVQLVDAYHCYSEDSVYVDVKTVVTINAGPDTSICKPEGYTLRTTSDALHYKWVPSAFLNNDTIKNPFASPPVTTTYKVIANIGKCQSEDEVKIIVAPYPKADAGKDTAICFGSSGHITATGGSIYSWTPTTFLSNPNIPNPAVIIPTSDITYTVTVRDTLGCTKAIQDSVFVKVVWPLNVDAGPPDTSLVEGQTIMLNATGALTYAWSPDTWLSSTTSPNPLSSPENDIWYYLTGTDQYGCKGKDSIHLRVYFLDSDMYVPTAFTPNGDGINDVIKPIMLGMRSLNYFKVYNRFGELMFYTTEIDKGWDGVYKGKPQDPATFVWMAQGVTYKGKTKTRKGYVVLIR